MEARISSMAQAILLITLLTVHAGRTTGREQRKFEEKALKTEGPKGRSLFGPAGLEFGIGGAKFSIGGALHGHGLGGGGWGWRPFPGSHLGGFYGGIIPGLGFGLHGLHGHHNHLHHHYKHHYGGYNFGWGWNSQFLPYY